MDMADLHRLFQYDRWANRQVALALAKSPSPPSKCTRWVAHIVGAEEVWLARLKRQATPVPVWPEFSVAKVLEHLDVLDRAWAEFFDGLDDSTLRSDCEYVNSKGERFASPVSDILTHVVMHSVYHRGQIAAEMRAAGLEPIYTDYIHAVRQKYVGD